MSMCKSYKRLDYSSSLHFNLTQATDVPGRSVMLEQPRKPGTRVISHMLASHGGEIYIHVLSTTRSTLEDPPSISEGCGGRVTDYRINVRLLYTLADKRG